VNALSKSLILVAALGIGSALATPDTVMRCQTVQERDVVRFTCENVPVTSDFVVPLPEIPEPPNFDAAIKVPLPEIPQVPNLAEVIAVPMPPLPEPPTALPASALASPPPAEIVVPAPAIAQTPAPPVILSTDEIVSALRQLRTGPRANRALIDEATAVMLKRGGRALWTDATGTSPQGKALLARLAAASDEGLMTDRYEIAQAPPGAKPAYAELAMSAAAILYARDVSVGRIAPGLVHELATPDRSIPSAEAILERLAAAEQIDAALSDFHPPHPEYQRLKEQLKALRAKSDAPLLADLKGPELRIGMRDERVPELRRRLGLQAKANIVFDRQLSSSIVSLQRQARLPVNGILTEQTIANARASFRNLQQQQAIIANMEMWRWLPRSLGENHVFVNIPSKGLVMRKRGKPVFETRTIIGTLETQTPIFSHAMDHVIVNPSWFVPPSILKKDPRYLDPEWVKARGYSMAQRGENVIVRVPPGPKNALGNIKFMFPNSHAVYLHDTPERGRFASSYRALSNGCVRVENPFRLAAAIFADEGWSEERFRRLVGSGERRMNLSRKLPIHLAYLTLEVRENGELVQHPDVYGHIRRLTALLSRS
jgi:L,D-transpeptidase YcbB